ncbi:hypothetical protein OIO90_000819 [Microbotryomycetes sp. JL221]|nr:hypothetical protein OIO90_000819 [Microbotryomycetes sp. JL221]
MAAAFTSSTVTASRRTLLQHVVSTPAVFGFASTSSKPLTATAWQYFNTSMPQDARSTSITVSSLMDRWLMPASEALAGLRDLFPPWLLAAPKRRTTHSAKRMKASNKALKEKNITSFQGPEFVPYQNGKRGWEAKPGTKETVRIPEKWNGRIGVRRGCSGQGKDLKCLMADTPGGLEPELYVLTPSNLAEFNLAGWQENDFYDISQVPGIVTPMALEPAESSCKSVICEQDRMSECPEELRITDPTTKNILGCRAACFAGINSQEPSLNCCSGKFNSWQECPSDQIDHYRYFKDICTDAYAAPYDNAPGLPVVDWSCPTKLKTSYTITFCPGGSGAASNTNDKPKEDGKPGTDREERPQKGEQDRDRDEKEGNKTEQDKSGKDEELMTKTNEAPSQASPQSNPPTSPSNAIRGASNSVSPSASSYSQSSQNAASGAGSHMSEGPEVAVPTGTASIASETDSSPAESTFDKLSKETWWVIGGGAALVALIIIVLCVFAFRQKQPQYQRAPVWPTVTSFKGDGFAVYDNGKRGWEAKAGHKQVITVPEKWNGRIGVRRGCSGEGENMKCVAGDTPGGLEPDSNLAEFNLAGWGNNDFWDISYVQGILAPISVQAVHHECKSLVCAQYILERCPDELAIKDPQTEDVIGCRSACLAGLNAGQNSINCCSGKYNTKETCPSKQIQHYDFFKAMCPMGYAAPFDFATPGMPAVDFTCPNDFKSDYVITFCPGGDPKVNKPKQDNDEPTHPTSGPVIVMPEKQGKPEKEEMPEKDEKPEKEEKSDKDEQPDKDEKTEEKPTIRPKQTEIQETTKSTELPDHTTSTTTSTSTETTTASVSAAAVGTEQTASSPSRTVSPDVAANAADPSPSAVAAEQGGFDSWIKSISEQTWWFIGGGVALFVIVVIVLCIVCCRQQRGPTYQKASQFDDDEEQAALGDNRRVNSD